MIDNRSFFKQSLLPQNCLLCGDTAAELPLCLPCHADLPWLAAKTCPVCALPTSGGEVCGNCLKHPPAFDATYATLEYRFPIDAVLRRYKYSGFLAVADLIASLMSDALDGHDVPDLLIPMPLHPDRLKERGFNQAVEISRRLAEIHGIAFEPNGCSRIKPTVPQAGLSLEQRRKNLRGVFECNLDLKGKHVVLLDDVMTTGASLDALATTVRKAGANRIECWVTARTLKH